jgi:hypothetical protein
LLAFGLENGKIEIYTWNQNNGFLKFGQIENRYLNDVQSLKKEGIHLSKYKNINFI